VFFFTITTNLNRNYKNFFDGGSKQEDQGSTGNSFSDNWGWWSLIDSLCNSRVDKFEVVQNWNVVYGLNMCCYFKDKQRMEQQAHREQMQRLKRR